MFLAAKALVAWESMCSGGGYPHTLQKKVLEMSAQMPAYLEFGQLVFLQWAIDECEAGSLVKHWLWVMGSAGVTLAEWVLGPLSFPDIASFQLHDPHAHNFSWLGLHLYGVHEAGPKQSRWLQQHQFDKFKEPHWVTQRTLYGAAGTNPVWSLQSKSPSLWTVYLAHEKGFLNPS